MKCTVSVIDLLSILYMSHVSSEVAEYRRPFWTHLKGDINQHGRVGAEIHTNSVCLDSGDCGNTGAFHFILKILKEAQSGGQRSLETPGF